MLWLTENLADLGAWSSNHGSDPLYPISNLVNSQTSRVWKSLGAYALETLIVDLGAGYSAQAGKNTYVVVHGHNFTTGYSLRIKASNDLFSTTPYDSGAINPTTFPEGTVGLKVLSTETGHPYRYWKFEITKPLAADIAQVGRIYVGVGLEQGEDGDPDYDGISRVRVDPSSSAYSPGHQRFSERKPQYDVLDLSFSYLAESAISELRALYYSLGKVTPFFLQIQTTAPLNRFYYVAITSNFPEKVKAFGGQYYWDHSLTLEQQL